MNLNVGPPTSVNYVCLIAVIAATWKCLLESVEGNLPKETISGACAAREDRIFIYMVIEK